MAVTDKPVVNSLAADAPATPPLLAAKDLDPHGPMVSQERAFLAPRVSCAGLRCTRVPGVV
jgi:hypothetical protein